MLAVMMMGCGSPNSIVESEQPPEVFENGEHLMLSILNDLRDFTGEGDFRQAKQQLLTLPDPPLEPISWSEDVVAIARQWTSRCETPLPDPNSPATLDVTTIDGYPALVIVMHDFPSRWNIEVTPEIRKAYDEQQQESLTAVKAMEDLLKNSENSQQMEELIEEAKKGTTDAEIAEALKQNAKEHITRKWRVMNQLAVTSMWAGRLRRTESTPELLPRGRPPWFGDCFTEAHSSINGCEQVRLFLHRDLKAMGCAISACKPDPADIEVTKYPYGSSAVFTPMACVFSPALDVSTGDPY